MDTDDIVFDDDPPQHTRVRSFLEPLFTVQRVREMTPMIDATVHELLDNRPTAPKSSSCGNSRTRCR